MVSEHKDLGEEEWVKKKHLSIIPKFDGYYEHWVMFMKKLLRSKEWGDLTETVFIQPTREERDTNQSSEERASWTEFQRS